MKLSRMMMVAAVLLGAATWGFAGELALIRHGTWV